MDGNTFFFAGGMQGREHEFCPLYEGVKRPGGDVIRDSWIVHGPKMSF